MSSEKYSRLADPPRMEGVEDLPTPPLDGKQAQAWTQALPRANAHVTMVRLRDASHALLARRLPAERRFRVLETLRMPMLESIAQLQREFVGAALPLPPARVRAAQEAEAFHLLLGHGYRLAAAENCNRAGRPPLFGAGMVALPLQRALNHYGQALMQAWRVYRQPARGVWQGLHRTYWFAEEVGLADRAVDDAQQGGMVSARRIYVRILLMALANPYSFNQSEQTELAAFADAFAGQCSLLDAGASRPSGAAAAVPDDGDLPPGPEGPDRQAGPWLDLTGIERAVEAAVVREPAGPVLLRASTGDEVRVAPDTLFRLRRNLLQAFDRSHARMEGSHQVEAVIGLSGLHYFLAGGLDFDAFVRQIGVPQLQSADRVGWTQGAGQNARVPTVPARVMDQSLGGYCLRWRASVQARVRVGELVGLSFDERAEVERDWMVGLVRWLRYEDDGVVLAGIELLARRARAVGLRAVGLDGRIRPAIRAIEIDRIDDSGRPCLIVADHSDLADMRLEVMRVLDETEFAADEDAAIHDLRMRSVTRAGEYRLLCPRPEA